MTVGPGVDIGTRRADAESDASVIARSRDEPEAFAALFDRHADAVHRYAARRLGGEVANDLVAETFTTAFQQRHLYDPARGAGADARPWLFGIATKLVGRHRRAEARWFKAMARVPALADHDEPMADRAADRVVARTVRRELAAALAALPARHRDVLLLVAWGFRLRGGGPRPSVSRGHGQITPAPGSRQAARSIGRIQSDGTARGIRP